MDSFLRFSSPATPEVKYTVRTMTEEDVPKVLECRRGDGFYDGAKCFHTWLTVDPEAVKIAVTEDGEVIGTCSACIHHDDLGFVGMYYVKEKYRRNGVGIKVWDACMEHIGDRNVCLNAVPDKLELYRDKGNFPIVESEWRIVVNETPSSVHPDCLSDTPPKGVNIEPFVDAHLPLIYDYDRKLLGYSRNLAIRLTCKEEDSKTFVAVRNGECVGFGTIKMTFAEAAKVGPLYADDQQTAEVMLKKLILSKPQAKRFVMITVSDNGPANDLVRRIGCPVAEEGLRLYRKKKIHIDHSKVYGQLDLYFSPF